MSDDRVEKIKARLQQKRDAEAKAKAELNAEEARRSEQEVAAATAWPSVQVMLPKVADELNAELGPDAPQLAVSFEEIDIWLGMGEVVAGGGRAWPASFTVSHLGRMEIHIPRHGGLSAIKRETNIVDLTPEAWREILLDYYEQQV